MRPLAYVLAFSILTTLACEAPKPPPPESPGVTLRNKLKASRQTRFGVVLRTCPVSSALEQCSRPSPGPVESFWVPTAAQIADLEERLPGFMERSRPAGPRRPLDSYVLQYTGFRKDGRDWIEVNAILLEHLEADLPDERWLRERIVVCDGGDGFWGVEYEPSTGTFANYVSNGEA